jgi:hypothetical protein
MWTIDRMKESSERSDAPMGNPRNEAEEGGVSGPRLPARVAKATGIDVERIGDEVVLMHLTSLEFRILNDVGVLLWDVIEEIPEPPEWVEMMVEARPEIPSENHQMHVARFVEELVGAGFLIAEPAGPG